MQTHVSDSVSFAGSDVARALAAAYSTLAAGSVRCMPSQNLSASCPDSPCSMCSCRIPPDSEYWYNPTGGLFGDRLCDDCHSKLVKDETRSANVKNLEGFCRHLLKENLTLRDRVTALQDYIRHQATLLLGMTTIPPVSVTNIDDPPIDD